MLVSLIPVRRVKNEKIRISNPKEVFRGRDVKCAPIKDIEESNTPTLLFLRDTSGSMRNGIESTPYFISFNSRAEMLCKTLKDVLAPKMNGWTYGLIDFGLGVPSWSINPTTDINKISKVVPACMGSTPILGALRLAWGYSKESPCRIVLLSDGVPTDASPNEILEETSKHANIPIDTIGLGSRTHPDYDPEFLKVLSEITGGRFYEAGTVSELAFAVEKLSPAERPLIGTLND